MVHFGVNDHAAVVECAKGLDSSPGAVGREALLSIFLYWRAGDCWIECVQLRVRYEDVTSLESTVKPPSSLFAWHVVSGSTCSEYSNNTKGSSSQSTASWGRDINQVDLTRRHVGREPLPSLIQRPTSRTKSTLCILSLTHLERVGTSYCLLGSGFGQWLGDLRDMRGKRFLTPFLYQTDAKIMLIWADESVVV